MTTASGIILRDGTAAPGVAGLGVNDKILYSKNGTALYIDSAAVEHPLIAGAATFTTDGLLVASEKIELNSLDGRNNAGNVKHVFRPGDYMVGNTFDPTGAANSTTTFAAMIAAAVATGDRYKIELSPGVFKVDPAVITGLTNSSGGIIGPGRGICVFIPSATGDFITLPSGLTGSDSFTLSGFTIWNTSGTPFTTGAGINVNGCDNVLINEVAFIDLFYDVNVNGAAIKVSIQKTVHYQTNGNASSVGIRVANGAAGDTYIGPDIVMSNGGATRRRASVEIIESGHYEVGQANLTGSVQGILIDPGAGQIVAFGFHEKVLCDSNTVNGMTLSASTATSTIKNIKSTLSWYSGTTAGAGLSGVVTSGTAGGIINAVTFTNDRFMNNQQHGFLHGFGTDCRWDSCDMRGNNAQGANLATGYDGLHVNTNVSNWAVLGGKFGGTDTAPTGGNQRWGIMVDAGASSNCSIVAVDLTGNGTGTATPGGPLSNASTVPISIVGCLGLALIPDAAVAAGLGAGETLVTKPLIFPRNCAQVGQAFKATIVVTNTATAVTSTVRVRGGTLGTIGDAQLYIQALGAGTAAVGIATIEVFLVTRARGAATQFGVALRVTNGPGATASQITGFTNLLCQQFAAASATFDNTAADQFIEVTLSGGATITQQVGVWEEITI